MYLFTCWTRGKKLYQVVKEEENPVIPGVTYVTMRNVNTGQVLKSRKRILYYDRKPSGYTEYTEAWCMTTHPEYMVVFPRDSWAAKLECPVHGICSDAMVNTKKGCAIPVENGQCDQVLIRHLAT